MSKSGLANEKVMKNYLSALLVDDDEQPEALKPAQKSAPKPAAAPAPAPLKETKEPEEKLRPVAKLLEKVNVIETPPAEKPAPAPAPQAKAPVIEKPAEAEPPLPTIEDLARSGMTKPVEQAQKAKSEQKAYRQGRFQALFFEVAGLTVAVPLTELGGIHNMGKLNNIVGKPEWFMGVMVYREDKLNIVNTARWVMPEKYDTQLENSIEYQYIIMLDNSPWGLACEKLVNTVTLEQDDVKWREAAGKRPWLAGLIKERMCALLDVSALIDLLERGQGS